MAPQEVILSACSSEASGSTAPGRPSSTPALHIHDLLTSAHLHAFKTSTSSPNCVTYVPSSDSRGGSIFASQEGKALVHVWAWQKDQLSLKLHLPEKLTCFVVSPNGCWAAGGSGSGQIYLWEISSGLLVASITAHYRAITTLTFTTDSRILLSSSLDASVHVFLVSRLMDEEDPGSSGKPYGSLADHTLAVRAVSVGRTAGSSGGRCWTASDDGTIKVWSLRPPFNLLTTFTLPTSLVPSTLSVDPLERFFYVGTTSGEVFHVPLFKRRNQVGDLAAIGGGGDGSPPIKTEGSVISLKSPITSLALSLSATHLLVGSHSGEIHVYSLPSHQHLRAISSHGSPITHLSTLPRPPDLVGTSFKPEDWPAMEVKPFERMRVGKPAREVQETTLLLRPSPAAIDRLEALHPPRSWKDYAPPPIVTASDGDNMAEILADNKRLKAQLDRAVRINEKMWTAVVDLKMTESDTNGHMETDL
ncbi:WD40-repeat-containing domain protein [Naematelia encephala]|uniref:Pre-rRNA-processing protein IPI3 n=1 Tax=Naematelia encephala TaxID=71784 RepID=A0A1Y2AUI6_9TREE|nr:WD40-repeat-containing domain protein [Naematelia encephala]